MITNVRRTVPGRQFGRTPVQTNPLIRNEGAKSKILSELGQMIDDCLTRDDTTADGKGSRILLEIRLDKGGIHDYNLMSGFREKVA